MAREIAKAYDPQQIEGRWAEFWVKDNLFRADANAPGPVFSIVIPPPNVTGSLHIGHMLDHTEIDILTRWHRMRGFPRSGWWSRSWPTKELTIESSVAKSLSGACGSGKPRVAARLSAR